MEKDAWEGNDPGAHSPANLALHLCGVNACLHLENEP